MEEDYEFSSHEFEIIGPAEGVDEIIATLELQVDALMGTREVLPNCTVRYRFTITDPKTDDLVCRAMVEMGAARTTKTFEYYPN